MTFQEALYALGVRENTLSDEEKFRLNQDGFLPLPNLIPAEVGRSDAVGNGDVVRPRKHRRTGYAEGVHKHAKPILCL